MYSTYTYRSHSRTVECSTFCVRGSGVNSINLSAGCVCPRTLHTLVAGATHCAMPAINRGAASRRPRENSEEADALAKVSGAGTLRAARIISNDHGYLACTGILTRPYISRCGTGSPIHKGMEHPLQTCCHRVSRASCGIQTRPAASHAFPLVSTMKLIARNSCFCFCVCLRVAGCALLRCVVVCAHALICKHICAPAKACVGCLGFLDDCRCL